MLTTAASGVVRACTGPSTGPGTGPSRSEQGPLPGMVVLLPACSLFHSLDVVHYNPHASPPIPRHACVHPQPFSEIRAAAQARGFISFLSCYFIFTAIQVSVCLP